MSSNLHLQGPELDPRDAIVPILGLDEAGGIKRFLGTGTFVGGPSLLLTADHVIRDWSGKFGVVTMHAVEKVYDAQIVERDCAHDLALLRVAEYSPVVPLLPNFDVPIHANIPLLTYEYGTTLVAGREIWFEPATRLGHMTRMRNLIRELGKAGDGALELSWPALKGASGAPVLKNDGRYQVFGVIVANAGYHLLPAQIESVLDDKNNLFEETRYLLPQAIAVNIRHLRPMYERHVNG